MSTLERGLRITGGVFGAKQTINAELGAPNSAVNKLDDIFKNPPSIKPQTEMVTPDGFKVKVNDNTFEEATSVKNGDAFEMRSDKTLSGVKKPINLPAWEKLTLKLDNDGTPHIFSGHQKGGNRLQQSTKAGGQKDVFPDWMNEKQILNSIKEAYNTAKKVGTQLDIRSGEKRVELLGISNDGIEIRMFVNLTTKQLESAFPQWK